MAKISASVKSSTDLVFQLLASLGSFLMGAKGAETVATGVVGMKLDLAAVEATAGGKEGTVICAKRAEGRVARTNWSGAAGVAGAVTISATGVTGGVGVATFLTVIDFTSGTEVAFCRDDTGANLALGCDFVIAGQSGSFLQAFAKIGLIPDAGGTWLLPRLVGRPQALALAMLAEKLSAKEAERMGLIWRCVEDAGLQGEASKLAQRLRGMPSAALVAARQSIDRALTMSFEEAFDVEVQTQTRLGQAHDYTEGVRAFLDKRTPTFKDR